MKNYAEIKFDLFKFSSRKNWGIFNMDDYYISRKLREEDFFKAAGLRFIGYSLDEDSDAHVKKKGNTIYYNFSGKSGAVDISKIPLTGIHNVSNIMSTVAASKIMNIEDMHIEKTLKKFRTLEHRIEFVARVNGIRVYNDSKATNPDATIKALESFEREITLILGGKDKEMDFNILLPSMDKKVVNLILIGETRIKILKMLEQHSKDCYGLPYNVFVCDTFNEAVDKGMEITEKGKVLLLSPACASFDMFRDYKDRGDSFKGIIFGKKKKS
jgi:UDP-N-acetylmuramoylalanine--D-glutamate ligase